MSELLCVNESFARSRVWAGPASLSSLPVSPSPAGGFRGFVCSPVEQRWTPSCIHIETQVLWAFEEHDSFYFGMSKLNYIWRQKGKKEMAALPACFVSVSVFGATLRHRDLSLRVERNASLTGSPVVLSPPESATCARLRGWGGSSRACGAVSPVALVLAGASEACLPRTSVPGGGAHADGVHHVRWLEV